MKSVSVFFLAASAHAYFPASTYLPNPQRLRISQRNGRRVSHRYIISTTLLKSSVGENEVPGIFGEDGEMTEEDAWAAALALAKRPYVSSMLSDLSGGDRETFLTCLTGDSCPLWEQIRIEANAALKAEPQAGPFIYLDILNHQSLKDSLIHIVSNELATDLFKGSEMTLIFRDFLSEEDERNIHLDVMAAAMRRQSVSTALNAVLYDQGLHALVSFRVAHRLWRNGRQSLAKYLQSIISATYSADIHPAASIGAGNLLYCGAGVVIGETATTGNDVSIMQGVTLGGTGKESGNRHPKIGNGVLLQDGATVLGNIIVGDGSVVTAKSIVTKPVPPLAIVSGIPAKVTGYGEANKESEEAQINSLESILTTGGEHDDLGKHVHYNFLKKWLTEKESLMLVDLANDPLS